MGDRAFCFYSKEKDAKEFEKFRGFFVWLFGIFFFFLVQSPLLLGVTNEYSVKECQVINKYLSSVAITRGGQNREG